MLWNNWIMDKLFVVKKPLTKMAWHWIDDEPKMVEITKTTSYDDNWACYSPHCYNGKMGCEFFETKGELIAYEGPRIARAKKALQKTMDKDLELMRFLENREVWIKNNENKPINQNS